MLLNNLTHMYLSCMKQEFQEANKLHLFDD